MTEQRPAECAPRDCAPPHKRQGHAQLVLDLDPADRRLLDAGPDDFGEWLLWLRAQNLRNPGRPA